MSDASNPGGGLDQPVVRALRLGDRPWARCFLESHAGSAKQVSRGRVHQADALPGFAVLEDDRPLGLVTYLIEGAHCEIVTLHVAEQWRGLGTMLLEAVREHARASRCDRLWLVTTNDNVDALRFYQRRGFVIVAIHAGAVDESRRTLKPEIPTLGNYGIPIRDEIELEQLL